MRKLIIIIIIIIIHLCIYMWDRNACTSNPKLTVYVTCKVSNVKTCYVPGDLENKAKVKI